ncbi:LLM class flavin-dependent oxidoreductase [Mycolicibacter sp. MYC123]|uniref:LLM class flavin-dependent oxidoreductase n=1 Tax=[Mycobacterium] zoologicum TaxID=2872311 RepID=A0ABU5YI87_9MYCO|nr:MULTISPECIES: LLM class flavin-dependent oxidoreductase [unclassified Mycolicibacter]MEB3049762.1 LLM class flavin-dependent oxidoreductase [Mycolicibacter sp. MYC123]MEB3064700.1 LLM class flavin-dependent oxidoreductase [Mycolicibacter sp. MYC101]
MALLSALRLNMTDVPGAANGDRYRAALEMASYADANGITAVGCEEHHLTATGWLPSPLVLAAAVAARTSTIRISIGALLVPLYDPVRLAEDIAVLDHLSAGRVSYVTGIGYRPAEYHAVDKDFRRRGRLMDECLDVLLKAWGDEPFDYRGRLIDVTPKPHTKPHPVLFIGGMSAAAARRAARFGLPFSPPMPMPDIEAVYRDELVRHGKQGFVFSPENGSTVTHLTTDPERAWAHCGQHFLHEATEYSSWAVADVPRPNESPATTVGELRAAGNVEVLTPQELVAQCRAGRTGVTLHPLIGGLPLDEGWESLRLLVDQVLPALQP